MSNHVETSFKIDENGSIKLPEEETLLSDKKEGNGTTILDQEQDDQTDQEEGRKPHPSIRRVSEIVHELYSNGETVCGLGALKGKFLQKFANKNSYVVLYGILGCLMGACGPYLTGTITTLEKRFKIPSTKTGIIMVGFDVSTLALCLLLNYYGSRGHRPRWVALGVYAVVLCCFLSALPQVLYGAGDDALALTLEFGEKGGLDDNATWLLVDSEIRQSLCLRDEGSSTTCDNDSGDLAPLVVLFMAQLIGGAGGSIFYTLGVAYMDDNIKRSKAPALISFSFFLRMLGPAMGYALASACLSLYISPSLTPTIDTKDPRWLGAWWLGWLVLAAALIVLAIPMLFFPKSLPRATARRVQAAEKLKAGLISKDEEIPIHPEMPASLKDMMHMFKRLLLNKTLTFNNLANIFYLMGYVPFWIYMAKYIEIMYKMSASSANFITGAVGLTFSAIGILTSGVVMSKYKPRARYLAAWNTVVGLASVLGIIGYAFLGCPVNDRQGTILASGQLQTIMECNADCHCEYVKYSPVCAPDGRTFISACHAGCKEYKFLPSGGKVFTDCACAPPPTTSTNMSGSDTQDIVGLSESWALTEGSCPVDCSFPFYIFLGIVCFNKFIGATARTSNFLVSVRCVEEKDKTMAMALGMMLVSTFAFLPSPILFGYLIDKTCLVWGKTCTGTGNCWMYNAELLRYILNFTAAGFLFVGTMFDVAVWFTVKDLKIFDEEVKMEVSPQRTKTQRS